MLNLGYLAGAGRPDAERTLASLTSDRSPRIADAALYVLGTADLDGRFMPIYLRSAFEGKVQAAVFLSYNPNLMVETLIAMGETAPSGSFPAQAAASTEFRRRMAYLADRTYRQAVSEAFAEVEPSDYDRVPWLIEYGRRHFSGELRAALRVRLDRDFDAFEKRGGSYSGYEVGNQNPSAPYHDDMLVALWEMGGSLHPHEQRRLEKYGYACDSRERLYEILRDRDFSIY